MTTQSIIVYRNPAEAMFWEGGYAFPLIGGLAVGLLLFVVLHWAAGKLTKNRFGPSDHVMFVIAVISIVAGGLTFHSLFI
jgi:hypothetical protein